MNKATLRNYDLRMIIRSDDHSDGGPGSQYMISRAMIVYMDGDDIKSPDGSYSNDPLYGLARLQIRGQIDNTAVLSSSPDFYGRCLEYHDVYSVSLPRAEAMARTLRQLHSGLDRLQNQFGYAVDHAAYVAQVASLLGITQFGFIETQGSWTSGRSTTYRWVDVDGMRAALRMQISDWAKQHKFVLADSSASS